MSDAKPELKTKFLVPSPILSFSQDEWGVGSGERRKEDIGMKMTDI